MPWLNSGANMNVTKLFPEGVRIDLTDDEVNRISWCLIDGTIAQQLREAIEVAYRTPERQP